jgi:sigma54-dependent transcription regulator
VTRRELEYVRTILERIKDQDDHVAKAIALVDKDLANYNTRAGQMREHYEADLDHFKGW